MALSSLLGVEPESHDERGVRPLLTRFAVARSGKAELPGRYDDIRQVWVVDTSSGPQPIIESENEIRALAELATKTLAEREQDDPSITSLLELATKTAHQMERDDLAPSILSLELITVTKVGNERPDL